MQPDSGVAASDRLIATKEEVALLRSRFEAKLAQQAEKVAKLATANRLMGRLPLKGAKRGDRSQRGTMTSSSSSGAGAGGGGKGYNQTAAEFMDQTLSGTKSRRKTKKRSALANVSNPHHLHNYVLSRRV